MYQKVATTVENINNENQSKEFIHKYSTSQTLVLFKLLSGWSINPPSTNFLNSDRLLKELYSRALPSLLKYNRVGYCCTDSELHI